MAYSELAFIGYAFAHIAAKEEAERLARIDREHARLARRR